MKIIFIFIFISAWMISGELSSKASERPVIRLDEVQVEGEIRRPSLIELKASKLSQKVEELALKNLIDLENDLLKPVSLENFQKSDKSAR